MKEPINIVKYDEDGNYHMTKEFREWLKQPGDVKEWMGEIKENEFNYILIDE